MPDNLMKMNTKKARWLVVSNRLPFKYDKKLKKLTPSSGGLVTALKGIKTSTSMLWIGSLPENVPKKLVQEKSENSKQFSYHQNRLDGN